MWQRLQAHLEGVRLRLRSGRVLGIQQVYHPAFCGCFYFCFYCCFCCYYLFLLFLFLFVLIVVFIIIWFNFLKIVFFVICFSLFKLTTIIPTTRIQPLSNKFHHHHHCHHQNPTISTTTPPSRFIRLDLLCSDGYLNHDDSLTLNFYVRPPTFHQKSRDLLWCVSGVVWCCVVWCDVSVGVVWCGVV